MGNFEYIAPCPELAPFVQCYWILDLGDERPECTPHRLTPQGYIDIVFYYKDHYQLILPDHPGVHPRAVVYGQRTGYLDILATGRVGLLSAMFTPVGVRQLLRVPLVEIANGSYSLEEVIGREGWKVEEKILNASDNKERVRYLESFLLSRLDARDKFENARMKAVVQYMIQNRGKLNVEQLAGFSCLSKKQFERVFAGYVGLMPKQYSRVIRFLHALEIKNNMPQVDLATLAFYAGFYDAAHLANEIKVLSGFTPNEWFRSMCFTEDAEYVERFLKG